MNVRTSTGAIPMPVAIYGSDPERARDVAARLSTRGVLARVCGLDLPVVAPLSCPAVVFMVDPTVEGAAKRVDELIVRAGSDGATPIVCTTLRGFTMPDGSPVPTLPPDASADEILGAIEATAHYRTIVRKLDEELAYLRRLGSQLTKHVDNVDSEMRLAGKLQRDFMPRSAVRVPGFEFTFLFRPASWVSGDIFDIIRIDEQHVGLFLADAVGHGASAALLTTFLRKSLQPTRAHDNGVAIVPPADAIAAISADIERQALPNANFATAAYVLLNTRTREVRAARGGHPYPILVDRGGSLREVQSEGGLLGISGLSGEFDEAATRLEPGEKLVLYTDGVETLFIKQRDPAHRSAEFGDELQAWASGSGQSMCDALAAFLDRQEGSLNPDDDVTLVVAEALR